MGPLCSTHSWLSVPLECSTNLVIPLSPSRILPQAHVVMYHFHEFCLIFILPIRLLNISHLKVFAFVT